MRLVDADAIKQKYPNRKSLNQVLDAEPTAYDVNKVVENLEEEKDMIALDYNDSFWYKNAIDDAIEIVKGGVVNEID